MKLTEFAQAQVDNGSIYVLGAQGQYQEKGEITEAWIKYREHNKAANYKRAIAFWKSQLAKGYTALRAYDCSGLIVRHLMDEGLLKSDKNANGIYFDLCASIDKAALVAGDLVFKKYATKNRMYHVGVYMGDGTVVHSKGRSYGVVREKISATGWNRFGRLKVFEQEAEDEMIVDKKNSAQSAQWLWALVQAGYPGEMNIDLIKRALAGEQINNLFGEKSIAATKQFQAAMGLPQTGEVDAATARAMWNEANSVEVTGLRGKYIEYYNRVQSYVAGVRQGIAGAQATADKEI